MNENQSVCLLLINQTELPKKYMYNQLCLFYTVHYCRFSKSFFLCFRMILLLLMFKGKNNFSDIHPLCVKQINFHTDSQHWAGRMVVTLGQRYYK